MTQNLISLDLSADDVAEFDAALAVIEKFVKPLLSLTADEVKALSKMGDKSEQFCRQAAMLLAQNREILPASFELDEMVGDLAAFDVLRPRTVRLHDAVARLDDTLTALGSDPDRAAEIVVRQPDYLSAFAGLWATEDLDDWKAWAASKDRAEIQSKIDEIIGEPTQYEVYDYPEKSAASLRSFKGWEGG